MEILARPNQLGDDQVLDEEQSEEDDQTVPDPPGHMETPGSRLGSSSVVGWHPPMLPGVVPSAVTRAGPPMPCRMVPTVAAPFGERCSGPW